MSEKATATVRTAEVKKSNVRSLNERRERFETVRSPTEHILFLQRTVGNNAVESLYKDRILQAKLRIGPAEDIYEKEADRVADQVMRMPDAAVGSGKANVEGSKRKSLQMKPG